MKFFISFILVLGFICNSENVFSQNGEFLKITYVKGFHSRLDPNKSKFHKKEISNMNLLLDSYSKKITYQLIINNDHSLFIQNESKMEKSDIGFFKSASSIGGTDGRFYVSRKDSIYLNKKHFGDEDFLVKLKIKKWKITDEFKFISDFKCYKALSEDIVYNTKGTFKFPVIAWFCPELPSFFGPAGYFGLPGLILELDNGKMNLLATKINFFKSKKENIKPFKKGIKLTQKEFDKIMEEKAKEMFPSYFKKKNK